MFLPIYFNSLTIDNPGLTYADSHKAANISTFFGQINKGFEYKVVTLTYGHPVEWKLKTNVIFYNI